MPASPPTESPADIPVRYGPETLDYLQQQVVGRDREAQLVVAALMAGRHLLLEGPPGTGKSTLLRSVSQSSDQPFELVEGNAELTPARLIGHFDPAQVLEAGYVPDVWVDGPLARALRDGGLLYLEEINRIPEETLNVLVTVMSEGEITIPRLATIAAHPNFRLVAAMNPFDAVGTARISGAVYDRVCRISMDYQSTADEIEIATRHGANLLSQAWPANDHPSTAASLSLPVFIDRVVELTRATRSHPEIRVGSSVRGAVDLLLLAGPLSTLRSLPPASRDVGLDAALTALSGRVRVHESSNLTAEQIITDLWHEIMERPEVTSEDSDDGDQADQSPGKLQSRRAAGTTTTS